MIKEINIQRWLEFTEVNKSECPFLTKEWMQALSVHYKYPLKILGQFENNDLLAAIPFLVKKEISGRKKLICLPFTDYLYFKPTLTQGFIEEIKDFIIPAYSLAEIRSAEYQDKNTDQLTYYHFIDIKNGFDQVRKNFSTNTLRNINISSRYNFILSIGYDIGDVASFFRLNAITRKKHGLPPQPFGFFKEVYQYLLKRKNGFIATVYLNSSAVASALFIINGGIVLYKYGASDPQYLYARPNHFLFSSVIDYSCRHGFSYFDLGICPKYNNGLRRFKLGWGAEEKNVAYTRIKKNGIYLYNKKPTAAFIKMFFKIMPLQINILIGKMFYRFLG